MVRLFSIRCSHVANIQIARTTIMILHLVILPIEQRHVAYPLRQILNPARVNQHKYNSIKMSRPALPNTVTTSGTVLIQMSVCCSKSVGASSAIRRSTTLDARVLPLATVAFLHNTVAMEISAAVCWAIGIDIS